MKRMVAAVFVLTLFFASLALAAKPQVALEQALVGYSKTTGQATINYSVHITNLGENAIQELSLTLMPHPPSAMKKMTFSVGYLGAHEGIDLPVQLVTPALLDRERFAQLPLFWTGSYVDAAGTTVEFPVVSKQGGAK